MLSVRDLMARAPITVEPEETLRSAADLLTAAGVSGAPVTAGSTVAGIVTLTDILAFAADDPGVPTLREASPNALDDGEDAGGEELEGLDQAEEEASSWFFEMWEDAGADVVTRMQTVESPEWDALDEHTVSEVMTRAVFSVDADASVQEAADLMERERIHRVLVKENGRLAGVLSAWDVVRAVARGDLVVAQSV
jgi:CBS domain-containing protein